MNDTPAYVRRTLPYQQGVYDENKRITDLLKSQLAQRNTLYIVNDGLMLALALIEPVTEDDKPDNIERVKIISLLEARYAETLSMNIDSDFWRGVTSELEDILHLLKKETNGKDSRNRLHHSQLCAVQPNEKDDGQTGDSIHCCKSGR